MPSSSSSSLSLPNLYNTLHSDIIQTHILSKLDGPSLHAFASSSSDHRTLCNDNHLWKHLCLSTWPSLNHPILSDLLSIFPSGYRSFYHDSFPVLHSTDHSPPSLPSSPTHPTPQLISAVDIRYRNNLVYSKLQITDTNTESFVTTPLWVELPNLNPTTRPGFSRINFDEMEHEFLTEVEESVTLSWILIDPVGKRAGNFSRVRPISVRRDWLTNEVKLQFVTILSGRYPLELVQCRIVVTCGGREGEELHVREVTMNMLDMESKFLNWEECLVILQRAMRGERRKLGKRGEEKEIFEEYLKIKRERIARRVMKEWMKAEINRANMLVLLVVLLALVSKILFF